MIFPVRSLCFVHHCSIYMDDFESTKQCLIVVKGMPTQTHIWFFFHQLRWLCKALFPQWEKLHRPVLSIASICKQLSFLQMEMSPKIATNGSMPLNADVLPFRAEYTCLIKLTLSPLSTEQTSPLKPPLAPICLELSLGASHGAVNKFWSY